LELRGTAGRRSLRATFSHLFVRPALAAIVRILIVVASSVSWARAQGDDLSDEFRFTISPYHDIRGNLSGAAELGYYWNPERDKQTYTVLWPDLNYRAADWVQFRAGLRTLYTDTKATADRLELRPFAGVKLFVPNEIKWNIYNYTRYEDRVIQNTDTHDWTPTQRLRSRFGVEIPLTSRAKAWQPRTWYGLTDVEPFYRFDTDRIDPLRVRGGLAYVVNTRVRVEFIYNAQFTRPAGRGGLEHTENLIHLNIKLALNKGILQRLFDGGNTDD
jgi:hypothetical protein